MSRRAAAGAAALLLVAFAAVWWWIGRGPSANEERVTGLIESSYDLAGFVDEPEPKLLGYGRDSFQTGCDDVDGDRYIGTRAASRVDPDVDWLAGAERLADALEGNGWTVARLWWLDADADRDERIVAARRDEHRVVLVVNTNSIDISVLSGPCIGSVEPYDPAGEFRPVDSYAP